MTEQDILHELDETKNKFFLDLEHGYFHTAGSRITLFADKSRWAIVMEKTGYGNRSMSIEIDICYYSNCLAMEEYTLGFNNTGVELFSEIDFQNIGKGFELVDTEARFITIRDKKLPIEKDENKYEEKGIKIRDYDNPDHQIDFVALTRYLDEQYPELFRASDAEIHKYLPADLPKLMTIDKWHHKTYWEIYDSNLYGEDTRPSTYETFQMIAKILVTKDTTLWKPTLPPNNDWQNWPEAGSL
ncbi:hypothetical protein QNI16_03555 [Cytophagaceae bacterium YF14B1]|uniref:Uncharacterized protein n=1 Tax=Xanthocytophaga flava TaxID=3048013 RepID=A0AAE3QM11_9BACT|nr:hypothetical protein [Xanthocytophaga flavus]MDJ1479545.1 hypothetical protein [Xanthocytophaga flavus]